MLPEGLSLKNQPTLPSHSLNILELDCQREEHVCRVLGVPESMAAGAKRSSQQAATHVDNNNFKVLSRTILEWQPVLTSLANKAFDKVSGKTPVVPALALPLTPHFETTTIFQLVDQDYMDEDFAKRLVVAGYGFPLDSALATKPNTHTRPPINGTERGTTSFIRAQEADILARARKANAEAKKVTSEIGKDSSSSSTSAE